MSLRRDVCGWCGCRHGARALRPDRVAVVCRGCGVAMLVTPTADAAVLPTGLRVVGTEQWLRVGPEGLTRRGALRHVLRAVGALLGLGLCVAMLGTRTGFLGTLLMLWVVGGIASRAAGLTRPARRVFRAGGMRGPRDRTLSLVRAVLVEPTSWGHPVLPLHWVTVVVVDGAWRRRVVARFAGEAEPAASALAAAIRRVVSAGLEGGVEDGVAAGLPGRSQPTAPLGA